MGDTRITAEGLWVQLCELLFAPDPRFPHLTVVCNDREGTIELQGPDRWHQFYYNLHDPVRIVADAVGGLTTLEHTARQAAQQARTGIVVFKLIARGEGPYQHIRIDRIASNLPL